MQLCRTCFDDDPGRVWNATWVAAIDVIESVSDKTAKPECAPGKTAEPRETKATRVPGLANKHLRETGEGDLVVKHKLYSGGKTRLKGKQPVAKKHRLRHAQSGAHKSSQCVNALTLCLGHS